MRRWEWLLVGLAACSGAGEKPGPQFCVSYELNYMTDCQGYCEAETGGAADEAAQAECEKKCQADLSEDDNFNDSCPEQAEKLKR